MSLLKPGCGAAALTVFALFISTPAQTRQTVFLAAASDLVYCLEDLNAVFMKENPGVSLQVATGSSGNFFAQIKHGAPFDVFLSANLDYPKALVRAGLADSSSLTIYAIGRLVLWTMHSEIEVRRGLAVLREARIRKLALANPEHAPYGRAAKAALEQAQLWQALQSKLVIGENIAQAAQFVQSGNVEAGIVALSLVLSPRLHKLGTYWEIPETSHPRLEQGAVLTRRGAGNPAAQKYLAFLRSAAARTIFDRYGFRLPN
ncbi:MAG: molybdate ABC transporter substrate-binding protein [candidate division KSB1 bacterium]|nr:molybdate ABC transporter substrate-binding protein [candidate division KSB1 bacterium]MDZ7275645.1 molybdate ABC transporter substrate-binding protein [candidate division KSB1 bacterium]MDZ7284664.1 molybdate ABC transporter substrate-binding protein [candidate division KSB1 bacterium]MDZ7297917.1 molybdate ABC transporter substrate-binding protein [candidate division KSB1 bacterium]MDZ7307118.1 molybdate ABC transporter substrate-binding protein [candidate division KSB1 bacterium]